MQIEKELINSLLDFVHKEILNGGEGSGDFDHAGRIGIVGGSEPAGTGRKGKYKDGKRQWVGAKSETKKEKVEKETKEKQPATSNKSIQSVEEAENKYKEALIAKKDNERALREQEFMSEEWRKLANRQHINKLNKAITDSRREYAEAIMDNFQKVGENPYEERLETKREYYKGKSQGAKEQSDKYLALLEKTRMPLGQPIVNPKIARIYEGQSRLLEKSLSEYDKSKYYKEKSENYGKYSISSDDKNAITKLSEKYKSGVSSAEKRRIIDRVIEIHKNMQVAKISKPNEDYSHLGFNVERNADLNRLQLKFSGIPDTETRSVLKSHGFRWSPSNKAWQRQLGANAEASLRRVADLLSKGNK